MPELHDPCAGASRAYGPSKCSCPKRARGSVGTGAVKHGRAGRGGLRRRLASATVRRTPPMRPISQYSMKLRLVEQHERLPVETRQLHHGPEKVARRKVEGHDVVLTHAVQTIIRPESQSPRPAEL